jgi:hypothetical protein
MSFRSYKPCALLLLAALALSCRSESGGNFEPPPPPNGTKKVKVTFDGNGNPVSANGAQMRTAANAPSSPSVAPPDVKGALNCETPPDWKRGAPSSAMRMAQYVVPRAAPDSEDGELALFYFGPSGAGGVDDTFQRWMAAFDADAIGKAKRSARKVGTYDLQELEVSGLFDTGKTMNAAAGADGGTRRESALLGAILQTAEGVYYFKLSGPIKTVTGSRSAFDKMLDSCKVGVVDPRLQPANAP